MVDVFILKMVYNVYKQTYHLVIEHSHGKSTHF